MKSLVLLAGGTLVVMGLSSPVDAVVVAPSDGHHESVAPTAAGPCEGAASAQLNTQPPGPLGTWGSAYVTCFTPTISMEVTVSFYQDAVLADKAAGTCLMKPSGAGCTQEWQARAVYFNDSSIPSGTLTEYDFR